MRWIGHETSRPQPRGTRSCHQCLGAGDGLLGVSRHGARLAFLSDGTTLQDLNALIDSSTPPIRWRPLSTLVRGVDATISDRSSQTDWTVELVKLTRRRAAQRTHFQRDARDARVAPMGVAMPAPRVRPTRPLRCRRGRRLGLNRRVGRTRMWLRYLHAAARSPYRWHRARH